MAYGTLHLQNKWFSESSPRNPHKASATLTFEGTVADGETVAIGLEIYEFKTSGNAGTGKIKVDVSSGVTADIAVVKLKDAINANSALVTAVSDTTDDTVVIEYKSIGTAGNEVIVGTNCTNASWGEDVLTLKGGSIGTPCPMKNIVVYATPYYYWCEEEGGESTVSWKRFTPASY